MDIIHYSLFGTLVREREELALVKDARAHDVELPGQVPCPDSGKAFSALVNLRAHLKTAHVKCQLKTFFWQPICEWDGYQAASGVNWRIGERGGYQAAIGGDWREQVAARRHPFRKKSQSIL